MQSNIEVFQKKLLEWGKFHIQEYPWRYLTDPYLILVAEFMLHRTQAPQVKPIYRSFIERFPTLSIFVTTDIDEIKTLLYPLGLHWRIRSLIEALSKLWEMCRCVPKEYEQLISIPGIGPYIAGATVCFSQNKPLALVDTNTVRVVGRCLGLDIRGEARRRKSVIMAITHVSDNSAPRDFYYAMIDLAHTVCLPKTPLCDQCPLFSVPCKFQQMEYEINPEEVI